MNGTTRPVVEVAVGVLMQPDGRVLLASRPAGKPYAGYWEFPGGKLEPGETVAQALARELHEELGIDIDDALPWVTIEHDYPHAYVRLHFTRVTRWRGVLQAREGQRFGWFATERERPEPLLPATIPCLRWLALPSVMAIADFTRFASVAAWSEALARALARGVRLVQVRAPGMAGAVFDAYFDATHAAVRAAGVHLVVNARHGPAAAARADGLHLRAEDLATLDARPPHARVGASVHTRAELDRAGALGLDYAVLGPVLPTATHPGAPPLEWRGFARIAAAPPLPVYAIGGLTDADLPIARVHGAHGIALLRGAWR